MAAFPRRRFWLGEQHPGRVEIPARRTMRSPWCAAVTKGPEFATLGAAPSLGRKNKLDEAMSGPSQRTKQPSTVTTSLTGYRLLNDHLLNKGTAFTDDERTEFELHGLLPPTVATLDQQVGRRLAASARLRHRPQTLCVLARSAGPERDVVLRAARANIEELLPIVYTPTVGRLPAFSRTVPPAARPVPELSASRTHRGHPRAIRRSTASGDRRHRRRAHPRARRSRRRRHGHPDRQAVALHRVRPASIPHATLPIMLDVGTDNRRAARRSALHRLATAARARSGRTTRSSRSSSRLSSGAGPTCCCNGRTSPSTTPTRLLVRYRDRLCTFNDDIQGTAAVAAGTLLAAINVTGVPLASSASRSRVRRGRLGIAELMVRAMVEAGLPTRARRRFYAGRSRRPACRRHDRDSGPVADCPTARCGTRVERMDRTDRSRYSTWSPREADDVDRRVRPGWRILRGGGARDGRPCDRPVMFPLSNPTSRAEGTPAASLLDRRPRLVGSRQSISAAVRTASIRRERSQTNNSFIFPGVGLGASPAVRVA